MPAYTCIARVHMERMCARNSIEGRHKSRGRVKKKFSRLREKKRKRKEGKEEKRKGRGLKGGGFLRSSGIRVASSWSARNDLRPGSIEEGGLVLS